MMTTHRLVKNDDGSTSWVPGNYYHDQQGRVIVKTLFQHARYILKTCEALQCVGVCHADLKPANVLLDAKLKPRVTDVGQALALRGCASVQSKLGRGTPAFMAVEQLRQFVCGPKQDMVSFALTFWQMWTGCVPHKDLAKAVMCAPPGHCSRKCLLLLFAAALVASAGMSFWNIEICPAALLCRPFLRSFLACTCIFLRIQAACSHC